MPGGPAFRARMNTIETCTAQVAAVADWFDDLAARSERLPSAPATSPDDVATLQ